MTVNKRRIFTNVQRGAGMAEVLMAIAVAAIGVPFIYDRISRTTRDIHNIAVARNIIALRAPVNNFVRQNQEFWPDVAQIKLDADELAAISDMPRVAFIDKYSVRGASFTDVYLVFGADTFGGRIDAASVAGHIGSDAAIVADDGAAYGDAWAVAGPDFTPGDLVLRIRRDFSGQDTEKYLHRGTSGEDDLNMMLRDLNMGANTMVDVGTFAAQSARITDASAFFVDADNVSADQVFFTAGANADGASMFVGDMRVTGDITGFRNIVADSMNGRGYSTTGRVIADRATVTNAVNVSGDLTVKPSSTRTISGFTAVSANSVLVPFLGAENIVFLENFGLTISGELLMSTTPPIKIGSWVFPSFNPPRFNAFTISRARMPQTPTADEFAPLMGAGWQTNGGTQ